MPFVTIKGVEHFYNIHNIEKKDTILFIHGHPFDHSQWQYQIDSFIDFKLLMPDLKGYGKTFDTSSPKIFIEDHAQELAIMLDALNIETVNLVGLSMGGQIAVEFSKQYPHLTKSIILCNTLPYAETLESKQIRINAGKKLIELGMAYHVENDIAKYIHPKNYTNENKVYQHLKSMMLSTNATSAAANQFGRAERRDNTTFLKQFKKPIWFITGEIDNFTPVEKMIEIANIIAPNIYTTITKSGHITNMENPTEFNKALQKFYTNYF